MVKVGLVNLDISHPKSWGEKMEAFCMDIKYHYLCNKGFRKAGQFLTRTQRLGGRVRRTSKQADEIVRFGATPLEPFGDIGKKAGKFCKESAKPQ